MRPEVFRRKVDLKAVGITSSVVFVGGIALALLLVVLEINYYISLSILVAYCLASVVFVVGSAYHK